MRENMTKRGNGGIYKGEYPQLLSCIHTCLISLISPAWFISPSILQQIVGLNDYCKRRNFRAVHIFAQFAQGLTCAKI